MHLKKFLVPLVLIFITALLIYVLLFHEQQPHPISLEDNNSPDELSGPGVLSMSIRTDPNLRTFLQKQQKRVFDSNNVKTYLSEEYNSHYPLIEIVCKMRDLSGDIKPLKLTSLNLGCDEQGGLYSMEKSSTLRLEIRKELEYYSYNAILYGKVYRARGNLIQLVKGKAGNIHASTQEIKFRTPDTNELQPGQIYTIELLLFDQI